MTDVFTQAKRREIMQAVRRKNTAPENTVADLLRSLDIRFVQHPDDLPGRPDFYFPDVKVVVFINGCFWHSHRKCAKGKNRPKSNCDYWQWRIGRNIRRDHRVARKLRAMGFAVYTLWECEIRKHGVPIRLINRIGEGLSKESSLKVG